MSKPNVVARLTSDYDLWDEAEGIINLEIVPDRIIHVDHFELVETELDEVWDLVRG